VPPASAIALAAALAAAAVATGCGGSDGAPPEAVRALQLQAPPPITKTAARRSAPPRAVRERVEPAVAPRVGSRALGRPNRGRLLNGVQLPEAGGAVYATWDPIRHQTPNRPERRWSTDAMVEVLVRVLGEFHAAHPDLPPVLVGDLSRPHGGVFDRRYGGLGHASHQNGLDADVLYPRRDRTLRAATRPQDVDRALAQELVDRFVAAGARFAFVGQHVGLTGPKRVVQPIPHHDDHVHVRIANPRAPR
jgi:murein endopeptidase